MILNLFITLFLVFFILLILGITTDSAFGIISGFYLIILSICLLFTPLTYPVGTTQITTYSYLNATSGVIDSTTTTASTTYDSFSETIPKIGMTINSVIMFIMTIVGVCITAYFIFNWGKKA